MHSYFAATAYTILTITQTSRSSKSSRRIFDTAIERVGRDELIAFWTLQYDNVIFEQAFWGHGTVSGGNEGRQLYHRGGKMISTVM
jgi:hypothetical protein